MKAVCQVSLGATSYRRPNDFVNLHYNRKMDAQRVYRNLIWQDPDRMSGAVCFFGTRIPVSFLFDYLERGEKLEDFASDYRIEPAMAREVVHLAGEGIESYLDKAA